MNKAKWFPLAVCLALLALAPPAVFGLAELPFADGFENGWSLSTATNWSMGGTGAVAVSTVHVMGSNSVAVSNASLTLNLGRMQSQGYPNVWYRVFAQPVPGTSDPGVQNVTGAFYVRTDNVLRVYGSNGWQNAGTNLMPASTWKGFAVHVDYIDRKWDIYYTTEASPSNMVRANAAPIAFPTAIHQTNRATSFMVQSGSNACVDAVAVSPAWLPLAANPFQYVALMDFGANAKGYMRLPIFNYGNSGANNTMAGRLGNDIGTAIRRSPGDTAGDMLYVQSTNQWRPYMANATGACVQIVSQINVTEQTPSVTFDLSTVIRIDRTNAASCAFFPYNDDADLWSRNGLHTTQAVGLSMSRSLSPRNSDNPQGLTAMSWPSSGTNVNNLGFTNATHVNHGDWMSQYDEASGGFRTWLWSTNRTDGAGWDRSGGTAGDTIAEGSILWVQRTNSSAVDFNITIR